MATCCQRDARGRDVMGYRLKAGAGGRRESDGARLPVAGNSHGRIKLHGDLMQKK